MFKVIVAGSRNFADYRLLEHKCDWFLADKKSDGIEIVSGTAIGADTLGIRYAEKHGYAVRRFPADWETYGKGAGHRRNAQMAEYADALIAFWNGKSRGTKNMIETMRLMKKPVRVVLSASK